MMTIEKLIELYKKRQAAYEKAQEYMPRIGEVPAVAPDEIRAKVQKDIDKYLAEQDSAHAEKLYEDAIAKMAQQQ